MNPANTFPSISPTVAVVGNGRGLHSGAVTMKPSIRPLPILLLAALAAGPAPAENMTLNDAVTQVRGREDGRVLRAETQRNDASEEHRVRILTNEGRVRQYRIDARTGRVLPPGGPGERR